MYVCIMCAHVSGHLLDIVRSEKVQTDVGIESCTRSYIPYSGYLLRIRTLTKLNSSDT